VSSFTSAAMADAFVVLERLAMMNLNYLRDPERYPKLKTSYTPSVKCLKCVQTPWYILPMLIPPHIKLSKNKVKVVSSENR